MATTYPMPDAAKVKLMLGLLFDGLDVKPGKKFDIVPPLGQLVGLYVSDDGKPVAACAVDVALAANSAAGAVDAAAGRRQGCGQDQGAHRGHGGRTCRRS